jgi:hypothetical protein
VLKKEPIKIEIDRDPQRRCDVVIELSKGSETITLFLSDKKGEVSVNMTEGDGGAYVGKFKFKENRVEWCPS